MPMKTIKTILLLFLMHCSALTAQQLSDFKWENRVLILSNSPTHTNDFKNALQVIKDSSKEIEQRDLIVLIYKEDNLYNLEDKEIFFKNTNNTIKHLSGFLLIGKDGGIKSKQPYPLQLEEIFELVDSMPMRKAEMKSTN
tara:strand:+ start:721 stop:1140 length:420 start_codon:yes stop_codon:yes gene_type:complete